MIDTPILGRSVSQRQVFQAGRVAFRAHGAALYLLREPGHLVLQDMSCFWLS